MFKGKVEQVKEVKAAPLDVVRVLLPLLDAQFSFGYGFALDVFRKRVIRLPVGIMELGSITAPALWNRLSTAIGLAQDTQRNQILPDFIRARFVMMKRIRSASNQGAPGLDLQICLESRGVAGVDPKELFGHVHRIFNFGFHGLPKARSALGYSDRIYGKALDSTLVVLESCPYEADFLRGAIEKLRRRFNFMHWDELRIFDLAPTELLEIMELLSSSSYRSGNCICIPKQILVKNLKMKTGKTAAELIGRIERLSNKRPQSTQVLSEPNSGQSTQLGDDWVGVLPLLDVRGFTATSLWFMHYLVVEALFRRTHQHAIQRGLSMEVFLEEAMRENGFSVLRSVKWIPLTPEIEGKKTLEIDIFAYKKGVVLLIQCKSYSKERKSDPWPLIVKNARYWRKCAEYLSKNVGLVFEKLLERDTQIHDLSKHEGIKIIVPVLVTEWIGYGVVEGCRVTYMLKFLGEILFLDAWDLWQQMVTMGEAVAVGDPSKQQTESH